VKDFEERVAWQFPAANRAVAQQMVRVKAPRGEERHDCEESFENGPREDAAQ
jgi:hypothetical protein